MHVSLFYLNTRVLSHGVPLSRLRKSVVSSATLRKILTTKRATVKSRAMARARTARILCKKKRGNKKKTVVRTALQISTRRHSRRVETLFTRPSRERVCTEGKLINRVNRFTIHVHSAATAGINSASVWQCINYTIVIMSSGRSMSRARAN